MELKHNPENWIDHTRMTDDGAPDPQWDESRTLPPPSADPKWDSRNEMVSSFTLPARWQEVDKTDAAAVEEFVQEVMDSNFVLSSNLTRLREAGVRKTRLIHSLREQQVDASAIVESLHDQLAAHEDRPVERLKRLIRGIDRVEVRDILFSSRDRLKR